MRRWRWSRELEKLREPSAKSIRNIRSTRTARSSSRLRGNPKSPGFASNRVVTVIDAGRIVNPRTARNQIEGAIVMGVGMALFEETHYDPRSGAPINSNLADYIVATNADTPQMDVTFLDYPDTKVNELGARGVGEIGLAGVASAIASAVYHATGVRVRTLPIEIEKLL